MDVMSRDVIDEVPLPARRALRNLGAELRDGRRRRRIPTALMAERARISRTTLAKVEKGDPRLSMGSYATMLFLLGLERDLADLADVRHDTTGLRIADEHLPQRIHTSRRGTRRGEDDAS